MFAPLCALREPERFFLPVEGRSGIVRIGEGRGMRITGYGYEAEVRATSGARPVYPQQQTFER